MTDTDTELRKQILKDGKVTEGSITFQQRSLSNGWSEPITIVNQDIVEIGIDDLMQLATAYADDRVLEARIEERTQVQLDNYKGQTFSESTNYQAKFEKFIRNNERRLERLKAQEQSKKEASK